MTTTPERHPLSLSSCEDILAYVPHALGFHPRDSAVLLLIEENHLEATLRVDLPAESNEADQQGWVRQVLRLLERLPHIQGVAVVIYASDAADGESGIPCASLIARLEAALEAGPISLRHSWCRQGNQVWDYADPAAGPAAELGSLATNETNLSMVLAGSAPLESPWDGSGAPSWPKADQVLELVESQQGNIMPCLEAWDQTLGIEAAQARTWIHEDAKHAALLLGSLEQKFVRDLLPYLGGKGMDATLDVIFELLSWESESGSEPLTDFLLGRGWHAPDWQRLDRLWELAKDLLGVAREDNRHALLCILAWIEWARGRGSMALTLLGQAVAENENYHLAMLLQKLMSHGIMPEWATDQLRVWRAKFS